MTVRHSLAVHRLVTWYRGGADVQRLLPQLSTYLGHVYISGTQRYLTLTPEHVRYKKEPCAVVSY
jgi:site-specific recombinase XerD